MKPTSDPSLERSEDYQITPWEMIQRRERPNEQRACNRSTRENKQSGRSRQTLGRNKRNQNTLLQCWGLEDTCSNSTVQLTSTKLFGDSRSSKGKEVIRCASHNIHNMPVSGFGARSKEIALMAEGRDTADIRLWQEIGLFWPKVLENDSWRKRMSGRAHGTFAHFGFNSCEPNISAIQQPGGTAVIANSKLSARMKNKGVDPRGLGRWTWIRCGEENKLHTTFFSVYRPCVPSTSAGSTTYDQHLRHLGAKEPREALLEDLTAEIKVFQEKGDNIIVGMDANENIKSRRIKKFMADSNLKNAVLELHGDQCPSTTETNDSNTPVDTLMCSISLNPVRAGFDPDGGCTSDHSWIWADFDPKELFGNEFEQFYQPVCKLNADDPRLVKLYNSRSWKALRKENLDKRLEALMSIPEGSFMKSDIAELDEILIRTTQIRKEVSDKLRHVYRGHLEWSLEWRKAQDIKHLWWLVLKRRKIQARIIKGKVGIKKIRRLMKKYNIHNALNLSMKLVEENYKTARMEYKKACDNSKELRETFKDTLDEAKASINETTAEVEKRKRITIEKQREAGRALARLKRKEKPKASKVFITTEQGRLECQKKKDIEWACMSENKKRFSQANTTPPMDTVITEKVGFCAELEIADDILDGTDNLEWVGDKYLKMVLEGMRRPNIVRIRGDISTDITLEEHIAGWKKQKLRTSSERTHLGFPDMKAATASKHLAKLDRNLRQLPYQHGFAMPAYKNFTDFQILKKAAVFEVEKMRTIQLMPAAFNMNNKKTGKEAMRRAETLQLLPDEQAGSRKGHRSILTALNKVLTNDLIRARRLPAVMIFNDAKSCYDRIVLWLAALALRRLGTSKPATLEMMNTLQGARHKICTAYGDSNHSYGGEFTYPPLQGVGQGNGAGPAIWVAISSVLLSIMKMKGFGFSILSALALKALSIAGFAFVDDTDIVHAANNPREDPEATLRKAQEAMNTWEGILRATGGAIGVNDDTKAFWYFLDFKFIKGKWKYKNKEELPGKLQVRNQKDITTNLARLEPSMARETLGVFMAMDGNQREQKNQLMKKARLYNEQLRTGVITRQHAWYSYTASFSKTLEYPMEAIDMSKEEWDDILKLFLGTLLNKAGLASTVPRDIIFSSRNYTGLDIKHPYFLQQIIHIQTIMGSDKADKHTRQLIRAAWEECRWECGTPGYLTDCPTEIMEGITNSWTKNTILFMTKYKLGLEDDLPKLEIQRRGDKFIMLLGMEFSEDVGQIRDLNLCRQFLGVTTVADVTQVDGIELCEWAWKGQKGHQQSDEPYLRKQPPRSKLNWPLWRRFLVQMGLNPVSKKWNEHLGPFLKGNNRYWRYWFSKTEDSVFGKNNNVWVRYKRKRPKGSTRSNRGIFILTPGFWKRLVPQDLVRANFRKTRNEEGLLMSTGGARAEESTPVSASLSEAVSALSEEETWAVGNVITEHNGLCIAQAIENHTAMAISDGSYKLERGTSAAIIEERSNPASRIIVLNKVPGSRIDQSPYRSELAGVCGIIKMIEVIIAMYRVKGGSIRIGLDGENVVKRLNNPDYLKVFHQSYDLLQFILSKTARLPINVNFFWVKGHQDDLGKKITYEGELNIQCDALAKAFWNYSKGGTNNCQPRKVNTSGWTLAIEGVYQSKLDKDKLYDATYGRDYSIPYETKRIPLEFGHIEDINREAIGKAFQGFRRGIRQWLVKQLSGTCATAKVMKRRGMWIHDRCPVCLTAREDNDHIMTCKAPKARSTWRKAVSDLIEKLEEIDTEPFICEIIGQRLLNWPKPPKEFFKHDAVPEITRVALNAQDKLGWRSFVYGRIATTWEDAQEKWLVRTATRFKRSSRRWSTILVHNLMQLQWIMWENRNSVLHDPDHLWKQRKREAWNEEITSYFNFFKDEEFLPKDSRYFMQGEATVLGYPDDLKIQWLESVRQAEVRKTKYDEYIKRSREYLRNWLIIE